MSGRVSGAVKWFDRRKGDGFVAPGQTMEFRADTGLRSRQMLDVCPRLGFAMKEGLKWLYATDVHPWRGRPRRMRWFPFWHAAAIGLARNARYWCPDALAVALNAQPLNSSHT